MVAKWRLAKTESVSSQQSEEVPAAAFDRITCAVIAVMKFVVGQVRFEVDES